MKLFAAMVLGASLFGSPVGCSQEQPTIGAESNAGDKSRKSIAGKSIAGKSADKATRGNKTQDNKMKIKVGSKTFSATLFPTATATAFKALLPLTLRMNELNGNEKKHDFLKSLPTDSSPPKTIHNGDLMLWGEQHPGAFLQVVPDAIQLHEAGAHRRPFRA